MAALINCDIIMKYVYSIELETFVLEKDDKVWHSACTNTCSITTSLLRAKKWLVARGITFQDGWHRTKSLWPEFERVTAKLGSYTIKSVYRVKRWEV